MSDNRFEPLPTKSEAVVDKISADDGKFRGRTVKKTFKCMKPITKYFKEYCDHSSLHGLQYLGEKKTTTFERFCWMLFLIISLAACLLLIQKLWQKWDTSPVLVTFSGNTVPISDVPFPAVTICSNLKVDNSKFNLTEVEKRRWNNRTDEENMKLSNLSLICNTAQSDEELETNEDTIKFLMQVALPCHYLVTFCQWQYESVDDCEELIFPLLTEEGLCCTFNMLGPQDMYTNTTILYDLDPYESWNKLKDWSLEKGFASKVSLEGESLIYPRRSMGTGIRSGFRLTIEANMDKMDKTCRSPELGFKMALHNPAELPSMSDKYLKLPDNREFVVALTPSIITTLENLRPYPPEKRGCFFSDERKLRFFKTYTQDNCEYECKVNLTQIFCECVAFYMPRSENTTFCGPRHSECVERIALVSRMRRLFENVDESDEELSPIIIAQLNECNRCLPACTEIQYDIQTSHSSFDMSALSSYFGDSRSVTRVAMFFKDMQFISRHRSELYGWTDFLANCGGILGLCLGFSVLSLIEILYFLTIRLATKEIRKVCSGRKDFNVQSDTKETIASSKF